MMMLIGPRHSRGAHDSRAPSGGARSMKVCGFSRSPGSVDSWTPGPKPLCHRHPTGPHPSGLLWTPAKGDSTKSNFALGRRHPPQRQVEPAALGQELAGPRQDAIDAMEPVPRGAIEQDSVAARKLHRPRRALAFGPAQPEQRRVAQRYRKDRRLLGVLVLVAVQAEPG